MASRRNLFRTTLLAGSMLASPAFASDVTPERLLNPDREPQNWLMNHRTYDGQRFSPLARIDKGNVKNLKLAYAVPLGGSAGNESNEATALAENGFPAMTFEVNGRQYVAIASGPSGPARAQLMNTPELKEQRHATVLYVFGL
jgi:hypothetical protein